MRTDDRHEAPAVGAWDDGRLAELMTRRDPALRRAAGRLLAGDDGAETVDDVLQEAYLRARSRLHHLRRADEAGVVAWLTRLVMRLALDARRRRFRQRRLVERLALASPPVAVDPAERAAAATAAREALAATAPVLARLPAGQRRALLLRVDLTVAEVAAALGCSPGAVRTRLARARAAVRAPSPDLGHARLTGAGR
ncbi:MAG: sigma-70 family RNA polymerase sigma factor [Chloroflexi bacterium]|nr:sigma-70 family RNA polymerase sigma factor [Chloroflexota bacterium]